MALLMHLSFSCILTATAARFLTISFDHICIDIIPLDVTQILPIAAGEPGWITCRPLTLKCPLKTCIVI